MVGSDRQKDDPAAAERQLHDRRPIGQKALSLQPAAEQQATRWIPPNYANSRGSGSIHRLRERESRWIADESGRRSRHPISDRVGRIDSQIQDRARHAQERRRLARGDVSHRETERQQRQLRRPCERDQRASPLHEFAQIGNAPAATFEANICKGKVI